MILRKLDSYMHKDQTRLLSHTIYKNKRDFPGGPVVKSPCFYCRQYGFNPWSRNFMCIYVCIIVYLWQKKNNKPQTSKWIKDINVRPETVKLLEENISSTLWYQRAIFFWICLFRQGKQKLKINKWDYIKLQNFCIVKDTINKMKSNLLGWIFASDISAVS